LILRTRREEKGLTQQQLADMIGKDRTLITKIEGGKTLPSVETAKAIGNILSFEWTIFFDKIGEETSQTKGG
jgi:putative transcriptional regulator